MKIRFFSSDQILAEAKNLYGRWQDLESEEKRKIVENITEKITIGQDDVTIDLCYLPSSSEQRGFRDSLPQLICKWNVPARPKCGVRVSVTCCYISANRTSQNSS